MFFFGIITAAAAIWLWSAHRALGSRVDRLSSEQEILGAELRDLRQRTEDGQPVVPPPIEPPAPSEPAPSAASPPASVPSTAAARAAAAETPTPATAPAPEPPPIPSEPSLVEQMADRARSFLFEGNPIVKVGVVVLFFGVAFLLRFAAERGALPIEARLLAAATGGLALLIVGWRKRQRAGGFGTALQGGGIAILYLTSFAASRLYAVLDLGFGFVLLVALTVACVLLAVLQSAQWLAILAIAGGFLAPILTSTGEGSHVVLFSYYAVLNLGILATVWTRSWRVLNWVGFAFTWVIGLSWGVTSYEPDQFATTEPFLIFFFVMYVTVGAVFALRQTPRLKGFIDSSMVFGTPIVSFGAQSALVRDLEFGLAFSAIGAGAVYIGFTRWLWTRGSELRAIAESYLALAVTFLTLAIPFALDDQRWTAAAWALEGAAMVWVGVRQNRRFPRYAGIALQIAAAFFFAVELVEGGPWTGSTLWNGTFLGGLLIALGGYVTAYVLRRSSGSLARSATLGALGWGHFWLLSTIVVEGARFHDEESTVQLFVLVGWSLSFIVQCLLGERLKWPMLLRGAQLHVYLGLLLLTSGFSLGWIVQPLAGWSASGWIAFLATHAFLLVRLEAPQNREWLRFSHAAGLHLFIFLAAWSLSVKVTNVESLAPIWSLVVWGAVPLLLLLGLQTLSSTSALRRYSWSYRWPGTLPVQLFLLGWILIAFIEPGDPAPLMFVPLLNPLEVAQLLVVAYWLSVVRYASGSEATWTRDATLAIAGVGFLSLTAAVARGVHHLLDVPYELEDLFESAALQTSITIVWTCLALIAMVAGNRLLRRIVWIVGAVLLAVVVLKLFVVDLSGVGTVARIISFLTAGGLMLLIGYFSPLPPRAAAEAGEPT